MFTFILFITSLPSFLEQVLAAYSPTVTTPLSSNLLHEIKNTNFTFSAQLIHRSSFESPFFDRNYKSEDHIECAVRASLARARYFSQSEAASGADYVAAPVFYWDFVMKYTMGTPPVSRYGVLDTGSSFTWFQCDPCIDCYDQGSLPFFNPRKSSSYEQVHCDTIQCEMAPNHGCSSRSGLPICVYRATYAGQTESRGVVSMETLTLSAENTSRTVDNVVFGCGYENQDNGELPGVVGVGNHSSSLLRQLSVSHFSYFLFANGTDIHGMAHFGPGASLSGSGANTPLLPSNDGFYHLNLTGISVDDSDLDLPAAILDKSVDGGGFIIDSGTTYTILQDEVFEALKSAIADEMYMYTQVKYENFELCYSDYDGGAPEVTFQFSGLDYVLCDANLWVERHMGHCLAVVRSRGVNQSVLGIHQQRNVQVGYDLEKNLLTLNYPDACPGDAVDFLQ